MARAGNPGAFEAIVDRYQGRLLGFCRQMLGSTEDAEDVLQEVFVNAYRAMLADEREINLRPWLYRIARNRCLNHLRKPTADAQESMDMVPGVEAASTAERVHNREEFRQILSDVNKLPETQRTALLLREMDALSYEEIAAAMDTTVPSVKSLLVRARISLAEASQARQLTCAEVRLELSEAAEGLRKVSPPVRRHVRECEECADFRSQIRSNEKALAALFPVGPLIAFKSFILSKLGLGGGGAAGAGAGAAGATGAGAGAGAAGATGAGAAGAGAASASAVGAALGGSSAASGIGGAIGGAIGTKAVAGVVTAAVITAGAAVEVKQNSNPTPPHHPAAITKQAPVFAAPAIAHISTPEHAQSAPAVQEPEPALVEATPLPEPAPEPAPAPAPTPAPTTEATPPEAPEGAAASASSDEEAEQSSGGVGAPDSEGITAAQPSSAPGAHGSNGTVVVTVGGPGSSSGSTAEPTPGAVPPPSAPPAPPPAETMPPPAETAPPPPPAESSTPSGSGEPDAADAETPAPPAAATEPDESEEEAPAPAE